MEEVHPEKYINNSPEPVSIEAMEKILYQMKNSICKIRKKNGTNGTGFFSESNI